MPTRPPSPSTPARGAFGDEQRVLATTTQLAGTVEDALACRLDETVLEELLLELDRGGYVEWVTVTRDGEYVWDLTDAPDRVGEAVAAVAMERLEDWLAS